MAELPQFDVADVDPNLTDEARSVICEMTRAWALFDYGLTQLLICAFDLPSDDGSILIGNMDTRTKMERLKTLYEHHGRKKDAESLAHLSAMHGVFVGARNLLVHGMCAGHWSKKPEYLLFTAGKFAKGRKEMFRAEMVSLGDFEVSYRFAFAAAELLTTHAEKRKARRVRRLPKLPAFELRRPANPRKHVGAKKDKRHRASQR